jgi:glutamate racemase
MIGIFDSGVGGLNSLYALRRLLPDADICYLSDGRNAPYGVKTKSELISLVGRDMEILKDAGAETVLIGCCTASAVYGGLPVEYRCRAVPIIEPTASEAYRLSENKRIAFLSTAYTKNSFAFERAVDAIDSSARVFGFIAQELVTYAERGERDGRLSEEARRLIKRLSDLIVDTSSDVLILGCTHFSYFRKSLEGASGVRCVCASDVGARVIAEKYTENGTGKTVFKDTVPRLLPGKAERNFKKWQTTEEAESTMP